MRRNTKTMYEWRKAYRDKEELMLENKRVRVLRNR